jgi:tRNA splicing endonuclease
VGIPLHGGRQLDRIESEVIYSNDKESMSVTASILDDLWSRGLNTRSGFKYGTTWRCYAGEVGEGHAPWLVVDPTSEGPENWAEACLSSRLASGVNKKWLYPIYDIESWRYLQISRPPSDSRWSNPKRI